MQTIYIYADGACQTKSKRGGWAYIIDYGHNTFQKGSGYVSDTTSNRMELMAVIQALRALPPTQSFKIVLNLDSTYVGKGITEWLPMWIKNKKIGFKKNSDLWHIMAPFLSKHYFSFKHIYGHTGHPLNEQCDKMAVSAYKHGIMGNGHK